MVTGKLMVYVYIAVDMHNDIAMLSIYVAHVECLVSYFVYMDVAIGMF